jgi:hypothetical protein
MRIALLVLLAGCSYLYLLLMLAKRPPGGKPYRRFPASSGTED